MNEVPQPAFCNAKLRARSSDFKRYRIGRSGTSSISVISVGQLKRMGGKPPNRFEPAPAETLR